MAQALICRNVGKPLPQPLDDVVAAFLGGQHRSLWWPGLAAGQSVAEAVRIAFRFPVGQIYVEMHDYQACKLHKHMHSDPLSAVPTAV
jgi:hypothetical protein